MGASRILILLLCLTSAQVWGADGDLEKFRKKYDISSQDFTRFENSYLESDLGLKHLTGLRAQLGEYTHRNFATDDLLSFAGDFARRIDSIARIGLNDLGRTHGVNQKEYDQAIDESLDHLEDQNPQEFLKQLSTSLMKSAAGNKLDRKTALKMAKYIQIRLDMTMMKSHLKDDEYMRRLIGESVLEKLFIERTNRPGGIR